MIIQDIYTGHKLIYIWKASETLVEQTLFWCSSVLLPNYSAAVFVSLFVGMSACCYSALPLAVMGLSKVFSGSRHACAVKSLTSSALLMCMLCIATSLEHSSILPCLYLLAVTSGVRVTISGHLALQASRSFLKPRPTLLPGRTSLAAPTLWPPQPPIPGKL